MNKKNVIILESSPGARLANQLWNFISIYAYCIEKGYQCENWSFFEDKKQKHRNNSYLYFNYYKYFDIPISFFPKLLILTHLILAKISKKARFYNRFASLVKKIYHSRILYSDKEKVFYLPPSDNANEQQLKRLTEAEKYNKIYFDGWMFRNPTGLKKYRQEITKYFQPKTKIIKKVNDFFFPLRQKYEYIIGVHVRQDDYSYFAEGKFFMEPEKIKKCLEDYLDVFKKDRAKTLFIICSDGKIDESIFKNLNIKMGLGKTMEDLYALSQTSAVIGSDSTFGAFAAYYGNIPFIIMQKNNIDWNYYLNKTHFFFNKYSTLVNY